MQHDAHIATLLICLLHAASCVELGFARAFSKHTYPDCPVLLKFADKCRTSSKYSTQFFKMEKRKKIYIFIAEIFNMLLNMEQDTKTLSDNGTDGCRDETSQALEARVLALRRHLLGIISFLFRARLCGPVTNTTRAETSKISRIFPFTPSGLISEIVLFYYPTLYPFMPLRYVCLRVFNCSGTLEWGEIAKFASVVSIKNIGNGNTECDWDPLYGDNASMRHHLALRVAVTRECPSAGNLCLLADWTNKHTQL